MSVSSEAKSQKRFLLLDGFGSGIASGLGSVGSGSAGSRGGVGSSVTNGLGGASSGRTGSGSGVRGGRAGSGSGVSSRSSGGGGSVSSRSSSFRSRSGRSGSFLLGAGGENERGNRGAEYELRLHCDTPKRETVVSENKSNNLASLSGDLLKAAAANSKYSRPCWEQKS